MPNKYCNLDGTKKIKNEYKKINIGFDKVEKDVNNIDTRVNNIITTPAEGISAQEIIDARGGRPVLGKRFEDIEVDLASHKADGVHQNVSVTSTDNATSTTNAPLKTAGGLAVAKDLYVGGNTYIQTEVGLWLRKYLHYPITNSSNRNAIIKLTASDSFTGFFIEINIMGAFNTADRRGYHKYIVTTGFRSMSFAQWKVIDIVMEGINGGNRMIGSPSFSNNVCTIPITFPTGSIFDIWVTGGSIGNFDGLITNIELVEADN